MRNSSGQLAEPPAGTPLPFSDFLDLLRARGLGVGLHEYLAVGKLLSRWDSTNPEEFRDAIAALVGRHEGEVQSIRDLFDELYVPAPPIVETAHPREYNWIQLLTSRRMWTTATTVLALVFAGAFAVRYLSTVVFPDVRPPVLVAEGPQPPAPPDTEPIPGEREYLPVFVQTVPEPQAGPIEEAPGQPNWQLLAALSASVLIVSLAGFWGAGIRAGARHWTIDAWQTALASLPGPYQLRLVLKDLITRLPRNDVEDAATLLARAFSAVGRGRELDVSRSLRETLRSGLRPALIYRPRRVQHTVLVLQDVAQTMTVHAARVESLLTDLRRQGVIFERWYFDGDVSLVSVRRNGPPVTLEALARRREDWPLLIISSGLGVAATLTLENRSWSRALRTWTRRVWLSPIQDPDLWPAALRRLPIRVVPMTRGGLMQAATLLAQGEYANADTIDRWVEPRSPVTIEQVEKLKQLASVVPNPTIPELQLLRQRFAPEIPERAVLHLASTLEAYEGAPVKMSDGDIREHLRRLRKDAPALELQIRRYLLKVLADSEPLPGSAAHLRWQATKAIHDIRVAEMTSADPSGAIAELSAVAKGPLWREVREAMERLAPSEEHSPAVRKAIGPDGGTRRPPAFRDETGTLKVQPFYWRLPRWQHVAAAAAIAAIFTGAASTTRAFNVQPSHMLEAYVLSYHPSAATATAGELDIAIREENPLVPRVVSVYRDSIPWVRQTLQADGTLAVSIPDEMHSYQVRAQLPDGAWALSNTIWAPSVVILIDAQPWAKVTVRSPEGKVPELTETTPAAFRLPPGPYEVVLDNGNINPPRTERITVSTTGPKTFSWAMPGFDPSQVLDEFGLSAPARKPVAAY
jgi:hypothetical protein